MAQVGRDNLHSRVVGILKVALPLMALGILSTLFLLSDRINPEDAIPYAEVDVADRLRTPRMTDAGFAGVTADGASLMLTAADAKPADAVGGAGAQIVLGTLETSDGAKTELAAAAVAIDTAAQMIELSDGVELRSSTGMVIAAQGIGIATNRTFAISRGPITATGPLGQLSAQEMQLTAQDDVTNSYLLVFKGDVRLLYQPER